MGYAMADVENNFDDAKFLRLIIPVWDLAFCQQSKNLTVHVHTTIYSCIQSLYGFPHCNLLIFSLVWLKAILVSVCHAL